MSALAEDWTVLVSVEVTDELGTSTCVAMQNCGCLLSTLWISTLLCFFFSVFRISKRKIIFKKNNFHQIKKKSDSTEERKY